MTDNVLKFEKGIKAAHLKPEDFRDTVGRFRTQSLFREMNRDKKFPAYFTLKDKDTDGCVSMRRVYLEVGDPTEYETAKALVGDYKHWQALCELPWFQEHLNQWRVELEAKLESENIMRLRETAADPKSASRVTAAKMLLSKPWRSKENVRGRPSKDEVKGYMKAAAKETSEVEDDYKRISGDNEK